MPINWNEQAQWADEMVRNAKELGCSAEESMVIVNSLAGFIGAPARVTKLATLYLEHLTELSEEVEREIKISEEN